MITSTVIFAFIIGVLSVLVVWGAIAWARSLSLKMTWWKWLLAALWYLLLQFCIFLDFTMIGEGEAGAGWKMLLFQAVILIILGVGIGRLIWTGRKK
jgi:hypothetical protein